MKQGYRITDVDTHILPSMELLYEHGSPALRERWSELTPYLRRVDQPIFGWGDADEPYHTLSVKPIPYERRFGESVRPEAVRAGAKGTLEGHTIPRLREPVEQGIQHANAAGRLRCMDREGVDRNVVIPGTFATAATALDVSLAKEMYAAYHRYLDAYCSTDADRLKATILAPGADPAWASEEIRRLGKKSWVAAVTPLLPEGLPVDDPDLEPIWQAMQEHDLPILHHSFFYEPPYFPGYRDVWGNMVVARTAAHPWGAQRLLAYLLLSGLFDRYPSLRVGFAETGAGWLPFWVHRLRMQAQYLRGSVPELRCDPVEYVQSGRVFAGIEFYEGEAIARTVIDTLGDGVLMYQSDFPHPQCAYPSSPDEILAWQGIGTTAMAKLLNGNAERFLRIA